MVIQILRTVLLAGVKGDVAGKYMPSAALSSACETPYVHVSLSAMGSPLKLISPLWKTDHMS